jgi:hypothetical protein
MPTSSLLCTTSKSDSHEKRYIRTFYRIRVD